MTVHPTSTLSEKIMAYYDYKGQGADQPDAVKGKVMIDGKLVYTRKVHRKGMWVKRKKGNRWDPNRINPKYKKIREIFDRQKKYALSQVGQSKATWYHLAKKIGATGAKLGGVNVPGYVSNLKMPRRLLAKLQVKFGEPLDYFVEVINSGETINQPMVGGRGAMRLAFDGRKNYYLENVKRGVFKETEKVLKRYPEIRVELES